MSLPLDELCLWLTRPATSALRSAELFRELGAHAEACPVIELQPLEPSASQLAELPDEATVLLSSIHAVRAWSNFLQTRSDLRRWRCAVVGDRALRALADIDGIGEPIASAPTARELAAALADRVGDYVLAGSRERRPILGEALLAAGSRLHPLDLYAPVSCRPPLPAGNPDLLVFYSPSAVRAWVSQAALPRAPAAALGESTAEELERAGWEAIVVAPEPHEAALLDAICDWWAARK